MQRNVVKKSTFKKLKKIIIIKINKIAHSCNLLRISFFKRCVKEGVVAAVFMFELCLVQEMIYFFVFELFYKEVYPMPSTI